MNTITKEHKLQTAALFFCGLLALLCALLRPQAAAQGVHNGLALCAKSLIPSLFPFLVVTRLVLSGSAARWLGLPLLPYTRWLGLRSPKAAAALLLGLTGGFAGGAKAVQTLYRQRDISAGEASLLLCCTINSGLGFVVNGVGSSLLGSTATGWLLLLALSVSSLLCAALCRLFSPRRFTALPHSANACISPSAPAFPPKEYRSAPVQFVSAVQEAVTSMLTLCGFVLAFCFLTAILVPPGASHLAEYAIALPLEVTAACSAAVQSSCSYKVYLCCAALSWMGLSVFAQIRALVDTEISLTPLLLSRIAHLPLSLGGLALLLRLFPHAAQASAGYTVAVRMPWEPCTVVFLLCAMFFLARPATRAPFL